MPIKYQKRIMRQDLQNNPDVYYVFGDNLARVGLGGQAKEMRGEPNAIGIVTKISPTEFADDTWFWRFAEEFAEFMQIVHDKLYTGRVVVFPEDGVGTGLADLKNKAPLIWKLLQCKMAELEVYKEAIEKEIV